MGERYGSGGIVTQIKRMSLRQHFDNYAREQFVFVGVGLGIGIGVGVGVIGPYDMIYIYLYLLLLPLG